MTGIFMSCGVPIGNAGRAPSCATLPKVAPSCFGLDECCPGYLTPSALHVLTCGFFTCSLLPKLRRRLDFAEGEAARAARKRVAEHKQV